MAMSKALMAVDVSGSVPPWDSVKQCEKACALLYKGNYRVYRKEFSYRIEKKASKRYRGGTDVQGVVDYMCHHGYKKGFIVSDGYFNLDFNPKGRDLTFVLMDIDDSSNIVNIKQAGFHVVHVPISRPTVLRDLMNHEIEVGTPVAFIPTRVTEPLSAIVLGSVLGASVSTTWRGDGAPFANLPILQGDKVAVLREDVFDKLIESEGAQIVPLLIILSCVTQGKLEEAEEIRKQCKGAQ